MLYKNNSSVTPVPQRNYVVVKFQGLDYPFNLTFAKDTKINEALNSVGVLDVLKIYEVKNRKSTEVSLDDKITHDSVFKVQLR